MIHRAAVLRACSARLCGSPLGKISISCEKSEYKKTKERGQVIHSFLSRGLGFSNYSYFQVRRTMGYLFLSAVTLKMISPG